MNNNINKISVYGDSILKGAVTGTNSGHLFDIIEDSSLVIACKNLNLELNNQSVFGSIVSKTQRRLKKDIEKQIVGDLAIIESGGNDCDYDWAVVSENPDENILPRTPLNDFINIFDQMISLVRENKITPLVMTMPPLVADNWFTHICKNHNEENIKKFVKNDFLKLYQNHELYNLKLVEYCQKNNIQIVDMRKAMLEHPNYRSLMCLDGIHPNEDGYKYMATIWEKELPNIKKEF